jgi:DNA-directed RNA polymerase specialized sigma24 family protein
MTIVANVDLDFKLLERWRSGDRNAADELFDRHFTSLFVFLRNKTWGDPTRLMDDTFLACRDAKVARRRLSSFRSYMFVAASAALHDELEQTWRMGATLDPLVHSMIACGMPSVVVATPHPSRRLVLEAMRRLPLRDQTGLELHFWEQLDRRELAEVLDIPRSSVPRWLRRALEGLYCMVEDIAPNANVLVATLEDLAKWAQSAREDLLNVPHAPPDA